MLVASPLNPILFMISTSIGMSLFQ
jgi:hypothetical protein